MEHLIYQTNNYNCGPTAIYNSLILGDQRYSKVIFRLISEMCNAQPIVGTLNKEFDSALRHFNNKKIEYILLPSYLQVKSHLNKGGMIILCYHWKNETRESEHYALMFQKDNEVYSANVENVAVVKDEKWQILYGLDYYESQPESERHEYLTREEDKKYPQAWFIYQ